ncbi:hypothetical protein FACS189430_02810 [Bacteroidia bacterium]|nr:hypothetical protein FACS189430_02810 [Bacteroidia bacterium]
MQRTKTLPLKVLLNQFISNNQFEAKLTEARVISVWKEIAGPFSDAGIRLYKRTMYVHVASPAVRNELLMQRMPLQHLLNEKLGEPLVEQIIIT